MDLLSLFALGIIVFVFLTLAYGIVAIHDIPDNIAKARNHPHQDAIHAAGMGEPCLLCMPFGYFCGYGQRSIGRTAATVLQALRRPALPRRMWKPVLDGLLADGEIRTHYDDSLARNAIIFEPRTDIERMILRAHSPSGQHSCNGKRCSARYASDRSANLDHF